MKLVIIQNSSDETYKRIIQLRRYARFDIKLWLWEFAGHSYNNIYPEEQAQFDATGYAEIRKLEPVINPSVSGELETTFERTGEIQWTFTLVDIEIDDLLKLASGNYELVDRKAEEDIANQKFIDNLKIQGNFQVKSGVDVGAVRKSFEAYHSAYSEFPYWSNLDDFCELRTEDFEELS